MRSLNGITLLIAFGCAGSASAAQTVFPFKSCGACTAAQMQTMAKNTMPLGIAFVYDLAGHAIRKYEVYLDSTCGAQPIPQTHSGSGPQTQDAGGGGVDCGSFKSADEMTPIDPTVQAVFDALYSTYIHDPQLAQTGQETRYGVPNDPHTGKPFNLQGVAWDYPNASFQDFMTEMNYNLGTQGMANNFDPYLGDFLYGFKFNGFHLNVIITAPPGVGGQASWDRNATTQFQVCTDVGGDCAKFQLTVTSSNLAVTFLGIFGPDNNLYPSSNGTAPGNLTNWGFRYGGRIGGDHFADEMRSHGVYIPTSGYCPAGTYPFLTTTRQNNQIIFQSWGCEQN
jgi:hypothetical protein